MESPADPSPFESAAPYYDACRPPYPPAALDHVLAAGRLGPRSRLLDLGCGPGTLAIPLSRSVAQVVAVDPDTGMLAQASRLARERGAGAIQWIHGRAEDAEVGPGRFAACVMGQSFHWMDRDAVLARLADLLEPDGPLILVAPGRRRPQESWEDAAASVVARYLGPPRRHPSANPEPHDEPALARSTRFCGLTRTVFPSRLRRDVASILGYLYSISTSARPLFGERAGAFEADLRAALLELQPSGPFEETVETEVVVARAPS
jgi:SAM-dependent methyltransferase